MEAKNISEGKKRVKEGNMEERGKGGQQDEKKEKEEEDTWEA